MEDIENVNPWEALGLTEPETAPEDPAGGQEPEHAEPAGEGEQDQDAAEPGTDLDMAQESENGEEPEDPAEQEPKKPQTKEERAANARRRREQEVQEAVDKAVREALEQERKATKTRLDAFFGQAKMKNAHNGNSDILSLEDAEAWAQADRMAKANAALKKGQLTAEDLQALMEESPAFKEMQQKQARQEQEARQQNRQQFESNVSLELAEIQKLDPTVQSLADIVKMDTGKEFARLVQKGGLSYLEAFKLANMDKIMRQKAAAAAAGAKTAAAGKDHLTRTKSRGTAPIEVPKDEKEAYRIFNPGASDAEIEKHYRKFSKG